MTSGCFPQHASRAIASAAPRCRRLRGCRYVPECRGGQRSPSGWIARPEPSLFSARVRWNRSNTCGTPDNAVRGQPPAACARPGDLMTVGGENLMALANKIITIWRRHNRGDGPGCSGRVGDISICLSAPSGAHCGIGDDLVYVQLFLLGDNPRFAACSNQ